MNNTIKKISSLAKTLYKSGKYAKWTDAIKAASKQIKSSVSKKPASKKSSRKKSYVSGYKKTIRKGKQTNVVYSRISGNMPEWIQNMTNIGWDRNGNRRFVVHYLHFLSDADKQSIHWQHHYEYALKKAKQLGGKKFHNKRYGGGVVFQSDDPAGLWQEIKKIQSS